jgi:hypothetical protein
MSCRRPPWRALVAPALLVLLAACSGSKPGRDAAVLTPDAPPPRLEAGAPEAPVLPLDLAPEPDSAPVVDTLAANRERLVQSYLAYLQAHVTVPQSNGLSGSNVSSPCELWQKLDPSARAVFLTLTARLQGSTLAADGRSMLAHVRRIYRIAGGQGATATEPGSCGGVEHNRVIVSMDPELQAALLSANARKGALRPDGKRDLADVTAASYWRESQDAAGTHKPFDRSDETAQAAPRGQVQFFSDPASVLARSPLGRLDLTTLVDPYTLEVDQDYDCFHSSNPLCQYVSYGPLCAPLPAALGTDIYTQSYGSIEPTWTPSGC